MASALDLFVDELLEEAVRRRGEEQDADAAWERDECTAEGRQRMREQCRRMHALEARAMRGQPVQPVTLNRLRGACAQLVLGQRFCLGPQGGRRGAEVRNEFRVVATRRGSTRGDLLPRFGAGPQARSVIESKYLHVPAFIRNGALDAVALAARVRGDILGLQRQLRELQSSAARPGLPPRVRMLFQLGGLAPSHPSRAALLAQVAQQVRAVAQSMGQPAFVIDALVQRRKVMREAARRGF